MAFASVWRRLPALAAIAALAAVATGCGSSPTTPSTQQITEALTGTLSPSNANIHQFTTKGSGDLMLTLNTLEPTASITLGVGIGAVSNNSCSLQFTNESFRVGTIWTTSVSSAGTYCVSVYDIGNLTVPVTYSITVVHP